MTENRSWPALIFAGIIILVTGGLWLAAPIGESKKDRSRIESGSDLAPVFATYAAAMKSDAPYRPPSRAERRRAMSGLRSLFDGADGLDRARSTLEPLGFTVSTGVDQVTKRRYAMAVNEHGTERAWGAYLVDLSAPAKLAIEVPHPNFDLGTEQAGLALYRSVPGSIMLVAGAHRRATDGAADVAHRDDSLFHAVGAELAEQAVPQVQLHGFHDLRLPGKDIVMSAGAGDASPEAKRAASELTDAGFEVCRAWKSECGQLRGTRNAQGKTAAELNAVFLHVEINRTVRDDDARQATLVRALASVFVRSD